MAEKLPVAFLAGLASVITPCVLPLVPGYLSAVSAVEVTQLGERRVGRHVVAASVPFIAGFTIVFVCLGAGAAAIASVVAKTTQTQIAGFALVVIGLAFVGLLPWPERAMAPGLLHRARRGGSAVLLGAAFVLAGVAFAHAMRAFRWVRSHYGALRVSSGATLVALGLLLFFHRDWWLRVALDQLFAKVGLGTF